MEDLELLIEGDKVYVDFGVDYKGRTTFVSSDQGTLRFIRRSNGQILQDYREEVHLKVEDNWIVQKNPDKEYGSEVISPDDARFKKYNTIIGEYN